MTVDDSLIADLTGAWEYAEAERDRYRQALEAIVRFKPMPGMSVSGAVVIAETALDGDSDD